MRANRSAPGAIRRPREKAHAPAGGMVMACGPRRRHGLSAAGKGGSACLPIPRCAAAPPGCGARSRSVAGMGSTEAAPLPACATRGVTLAGFTTARGTAAPGRDPPAKRPHGPAASLLPPCRAALSPYSGFLDTTRRSTP